MKKRILNYAIPTYRILLGLVLVGKISDWFLNYSEETNQILNTAMFCLIGLAYVVFAWAFDKKWLKLILGACGCYLILMNFLDDFSFKRIIGIICVLTPVIFGYFMPEEAEDKEPIVD